ncbi:hypothetical protein VE00_02346 [Pseudogymnoascus sp. WSF 3629]|nr:hypothetical protein VE00_02346 [Pseudogymnoascus sp. WSF 3629]
MPTYLECYDAMFIACEEFMRLYDPLGIELDMIRFKLVKKYKGDAVRWKEERIQEEEGTQTGEETQKE